MTRRMPCVLVLLSLSAVAVGCERTPEQGGTSTYKVLSGDGAWCWIQDPRTVHVEGRHKRSYAGWMTRKGQLQVGAYDHETGGIEYCTLKENWGIDDHNSNSFLVLPDRRLMAFYTRHNKTGLFCRTTLQPEDISAWESEVTVATSPRVTYSQPVYLSEEGRFYVFWRGPSWKPEFAFSADACNWSDPTILIQEKGRESKDIRPYLKVVSDGTATIHFAFTDGHPRNEPQNSIYYLRYQKGAFFKADGTKAGDMNRLPISHTVSDVVYDGKASKTGSWIWDIALDRDGAPVIVYARFPKDTDHRYHYACWRGDRWFDTEICPAGKWFPRTRILRRETEPHYSGGITLDHSDPSVVYLSRQVRGTFEVEKWTTPDMGMTWSQEAITSNSKYSNVRPVVPRGYSGEEDFVLWMYGDYIHYKKYKTSIRMLKPETNLQNERLQGH